MGSQTSRSNTHVANATGKDLRIYYAKHKMKEEMVKYEGGEIGGTASKTEQSVSGEISTDEEMDLKLDSRISCIPLPKKQACKIAGQGTIYVSVLVDDENRKNGSNVIDHNYLVPSDRSFIVTANCEIKLQKYGAKIWVDEDGYNHYP